MNFTFSTRAEALLRAILDAEPGSHVYLHEPDCASQYAASAARSKHPKLPGCDCGPRDLLIVGRQ